MSAYDPPNHIPPLDVFNPEEFYTSGTEGITKKEADARYLRLTGGILSGSVSFNAGLSCTTRILNASASSGVNPSYSFISDNTSGIYSSESNIVDIATNSVNRLSITNTHIQPTVPIHAQFASQTAPAYSFQGDADTGLFRDGPNTIGFACGGIKQLSISEEQIINTTAFGYFAPDGLAADPSYSFNTDRLSGMFLNASGIVSVATAGAERLRVSSAGIQTSVQGTAAAPSISWTDDPDTGIYRDGTNSLSFCTQGLQRLRISSNGIQVFNNVGFKAENGSATNPGYNFSNDTNSGLYRQGAASISMSIGGTEFMNMSSGGLRVYATNGLRGPNGSSSACTFNFNNSVNTGFYMQSVGTDMRASIGGTDSLGIQSQGILLYGSTAGNNAQYSASKLGYYEEYPGSTTFTGGNSTTASINYKITRIGNQVTLNLDRMPVAYTNTNGSSVAYVSNSAFPQRFYSRSFIAFPCLVYVSGSRQIGLVYTGNTSPSGDGLLTFILETSNIASGTSFQSAELTISWLL
jgi:hypothetical protein